MSTPRKSWKFWTVIGVPVLLCLLPLLWPDVRRLLHLSKSDTAPAPPSAVTQTGNSNTQANGVGSAAGNITGNGNVIGNNNTTVNVIPPKERSHTAQNAPAPTPARQPLPAISIKRLVRMAVSVAHQMNVAASGLWFVEDERLHTEREVAVQNISDPDQLKKRLADIDQKRQALNKQYTYDIRLLMENADHLRQELLELLLIPEPEPTDRDEAVVFDKVLASQPITHDDLWRASRYLENLANRVSSSAK